jgi:hypothetical protein
LKFIETGKACESITQNYYAPAITNAAKASGDGARASHSGSFFIFLSRTYLESTFA